MKKWLFLLFIALSCIAHASPLPATQVFEINAKYLDANSFLVQWNIKPGYFIYKNRLKFKEPHDVNFALTSPRLPKASVKIDKQGHHFSVYRNALQLTLPVLGLKPGEALIDVYFQGCSDEGFCYPPEIRQIQLSFNKELALSSVHLEALSLPEVSLQKALPKDSITDALNDHHWFISLLLFFGFGLLLSFTPCILPMVPVLSGIIVGQGKQITTRKAFLLSLSYVLAMSVTYAGVGAGVALLGANLQIAMQSPWAISLFSLTFVGLSLSMFGFYELRLPLVWQAKLAGLSRSQNNGDYLGAAIMGSLSTLILSPCVTAPLIGILGYIANTGNTIFGIFALFFVGLGMGAPLLLIGAQAGRILPASGPWMETVKAAFGLLLLAVAIYLMSRILPATIVMCLWAALFIIAGFYNKAFRIAASFGEKIQKIFGLFCFIYGVLLVINLSLGQTNPLQPLAGFYTKPSLSALPRVISSVPELDAIVKNARGKPVLVDFYADWCTSCSYMEKTLFKNSKLQPFLKNFVLVKADVTANNPKTKLLLKTYGVIAPPTLLFFDEKGSLQPAFTLVGEVSAKDFATHLKALK